MGRPLSSVVVRRPHPLNIFSLETAGPIKVKFHMDPLWDGGIKDGRHAHIWKKI